MVILSRLVGDKNEEVIKYTYKMNNDEMKNSYFK